MSKEITQFMESLKSRTPGESEFHQAVQEVVETIWDVYNANPRYKAAKLLEKMVEPERTFIFRVPWTDDKGEVHINRGYRVQFNSAIGPYKGGIRFHPTVSLSGLKFLGFEQTFKNSLTTLPMGGGKGGSDFNPKGKSENEIMRFCQSFMTELQKYIGPNTDVPAGDIGVGGREVGYMFGQYKRLRDEFTGVLTGKGMSFGGSTYRPESTGFGSVYITEHIMTAHNDKLEGKKVAVSGFGNVSWGVCSKMAQLGAKVVTISGPDGYVYDEEGVNTPEKIEYLLELRASNNDIVAPYAEKFGAKFFPGKKPWECKVDIAVPCAIQNELNIEDAKMLVANGCKYVVETSNMGCTMDAVNYLVENVVFMPGKAANAGGVSVSGLEMAQNSMRYNWTGEEVDAKLHQIMKQIHDTCMTYGKEGNRINYVKGANIGGFIKVAEAMLAQGHV